MSTQTGSISFESTGTISQHVKQNYATLSQIKGQFATSSTGASTAAKVATIVPQNTGWTLYTGATVTVKFTSKNTTTAPTLNVNNTGAKPIKDFNGNDLDSDAYNWPEGAAMSFTYDGTSWRLQDSDLMERVHSAETKIEQNAEDIALRATKEEVNNAIDDVKITKSTCGKTIVTEDAADLSLLNLSIYGECAQDGTPTPDAPVPIKAVRGRNLINWNVSPFSNALNISLDADTYTISAAQTLNNGAWYIKATDTQGVLLTKNELGLASWNAASSAAGLYYGAQNSRRVTFSLPRKATVEIGKLNSDGTVPAQLERGTQATPYIPYGCIVVTTTGKNLLDCLNFSTTYEYSAVAPTETGYSVTHSNGWGGNCATTFQVFPAGTYTLSLTPELTTQSELSLLFNTDSIVVDGRSVSSSGSWYTEHGFSYRSSRAVTSHVVAITASNDFMIAFTISPGKYNSVDSVSNIQLERGTEATAYEPYRESVSYIDLQGEELCSLPDGTQDVLTVDASGHAWIEKRVDSLTKAIADMGDSQDYPGWRLSGISEIIGSGVNSNIGHNTALSNIKGSGIIYGANTQNGDSLFLTRAYYGLTSDEWKAQYPDLLVTIYAKRTEPRTIDLGYIDLPTTFDGGTVHVEAEIQPQICGSWWTESGQEAGNAHQSSVKENAELRIAADGITSEVSKISSAKYVNSAVSSWTLDAIKSWAADDNVTHTWNIDSTTGLRVGDIVYVKCTWSFTENSTNKSAPVYIKTTVESITSATQFTAKSHGYEDVLPVNTIKSTINQSADSVKIAANHVDIEGAAIFSSGGAYDKSTTVVKSETQWYSSTSAASKSGGSWGTTQPTVLAGRYIWQRELVTYANGTTAYKPSEAGVCIQGQTDLSSYSTTAQANNLYDAKGAANTVNNALENYKSTTNTTLQSLQSQVDGQIEAWYMDGAPAETSYAATATPTDNAAKTWTTKELKDRHLGDIYYDINTGHSWRWMEDSSNYKWQPIPDSDATAALAAAQDAQTMANSKRRIFTTQPTPPYDEGDLWVNGSEIRYCNQLKTNSGSYAASDWTLTATDDTLAQSAKNIADAAAPKTSAVSRTQRIYYRQTANGAKPGINETWLATSGTGYGNWSLTVPQLTSGNTKYPKLYTAVQTQTVAQQAAGTACSCSPVQLDDSTTIIDGGNIITGSVAANKLDVYDATIQKIKSSAIDVSSINIGDLDGEIGGRNLLKWTAKPVYSWTAWNSNPSTSTGWGRWSSNWTVTDTDDGIKGTSTSTNPSGFAIPLIRENAVVGGEEYVLSFDYRTNRTSFGDIYLLCASGGNALVHSNAITASASEWKHYEQVITWPSTTNKMTRALLVPYFGTVNDWFEIRNGSMKLEKGNRATDWTPAPEDIDSAIDDASKIASNYIHADSTGINIYDNSLTNASKYYLRQTAGGTYIYRNSYLKAKYEDTITLYGGTGATNTSTDTNPKVELTSSDFKMTDASGTQRLLLNSTDGVIIGNPNKGKVQITDAGMTIYDTNKKKRTAIDTSGLHIFDASSTPVEVALFGSTVETAGTTAFARIGANNSSRFEISPTTLSAYTGTTKYFEVSASGLTWGNNVTAASQNYVTSQGYQTSGQVTNLINTNQNVIDAKKHTQVIISAANVNYTATGNAAAASLTATLYIDGVATTSNVTYQWNKDGTAISGATSRTLTVTGTMGLAHRYSCKCGF